MNYPFQPLADLARVQFRPNTEEADIQSTDVTRVHQFLGYRWDRNTIRRWERVGISERTADRIACELGLHVSLIWAEMAVA